MKIRAREVFESRTLTIFSSLFSSLYSFCSVRIILICARNFCFHHILVLLFFSATFYFFLALIRECAFPQGSMNCDACLNLFGYATWLRRASGQTYYYNKLLINLKLTSSSEFKYLELSYRNVSMFSFGKEEEKNNRLLIFSDLKSFRNET